MKIVNIVGARPNFMKIAPLMDAYKAYSDITPFLVHTGQHYDKKMSDLFFDELGIPQPDINLGVGSASHAVQTAEIMKAFEPVVAEHKPDMVMVCVRVRHLTPLTHRQGNYNGKTKYRGNWLWLLGS